MKTTDSVMRELPRIVSSFLARLITEGKITPKSRTGWVEYQSPEIEAFISHSLAEARREWDSKAENARKFAVLPDPNPYGKWVSVKNHNRVVNQAFDLLTGDNPERKWVYE